VDHHGDGLDNFEVLGPLGVYLFRVEGVPLYLVADRHVKIGPLGKTLGDHGLVNPLVMAAGAVAEDDEAEVPLPGPGGDDEERQYNPNLSHAFSVRLTPVGGHDTRPEANPQA